MDLTTIRKYIADGDFYSLKRSDKINNLYNIYKKKILKEWVSIEDIAKIKFLGASILINTEGLKYAYFNDIPIRYSLATNEYPYDVAKNVKHLVLWSLQSIESKEIDSILQRELRGHKELCWFEQTVDQKSVKGVWHVHVFVEY